MMAANFAPLFQHGESLARLTAAGGLFFFPVRKPYLRQASRPPLVFFYKGREEEELTARRCLARDGPERGFLLPGVFLLIAQLLLLRRGLWPGSASLPRLRSCLARPMPLARFRQTKKVSIKCDQNFKV
jgi:hypothetical protein